MSKQPRLSMRFPRVALLLAVAGMMAPLFGFMPARAQDDGFLSVASVVPNDAVFYAEISLDTEGEQLQTFDDLLTRLGSDESLIETIEETADDEELPFDVADSEYAFVVLASALENEAVAGTIEDGISTDTDEVAQDVTAVADNPEGFALLFKATDPAAAETAFEEEFNETAGGEARVETETINGVDVRSYSTVDDSGAYAVVDDTIIFASTPEDIEPFTLVESGNALADSETFITASEQLPQERLLFAYLNSEPSVEMLRAEADPSMQELTDALLEIGDLNANQGLALLADPAGIRLETVMVPRDGSADEEAGGQAADLTMDERVPEDTLLFVNGFNLGQTALLEALALGVVVGVASSAIAMPTEPLGTPEPTDGATPPSVEDLATPAILSIDDLYQQTADILGINLQTEFLDTLTGEYAFALWGLDAADPTQISAVLTSNVSDAPALQSFISYISLFVQAGGQGQIAVTTRTVADAQLNNVTFGEPNAPISVDYGIVDDEFLLGVGGGVDQVLTGEGPSLAENEAYTDALALLPSEHDGVFFVNIGEIVAITEELEGQLTLTDADESCGEYASQAEAQAAYDEDPAVNFSLDLDFDGEACEDFFGSASPVATPIGETVTVDALATVSYKQDGYAFTSSILTISGE